MTEPFESSLPSQREPSDAAASTSSRRFDARPETTPESTNAPAEKSPGGTGVGTLQSPARGRRQTFGGAEVAIVCSHYELGHIRAILPFARGSYHSPKLLLRTATGDYLLKRRSGRMADPERLGLVHSIQLELAACGFPVVALIGTKPGNHSMLRHDDHLYEMTRLARGQAYDRSLMATHAAGRTLARFHQALMGFRPEHAAASGSYHRPTYLRGAAEAAIRHIRLGEPSLDVASLRAEVESLMERAARAADAVDAAGFSDWPRLLIHGDWHPGNLVFRDGDVEAVVDLDSARRGQRILDVAIGALHFSVQGAGPDPGAWPDAIDVNRWRAFLDGYQSHGSASRLAAEERAILVPLMIEALIAEGLLHLAEPAHLGNLPGLAFLQMIQRKAKWLEATNLGNAQDLRPT